MEELFDSPSMGRSQSSSSIHQDDPRTRACVRVRVCVCGLIFISLSPFVYWVSTFLFWACFGPHTDGRETEARAEASCLSEW